MQRVAMMRERITERVGALFDRNVTLGFKLDNLDAPWEYSEEPHVQRRQVRADHVVHAGCSVAQVAALGSGQEGGGSILYCLVTEAHACEQGGLNRLLLGIVGCVAQW